MVNGGGLLMTILQVLQVIRCWVWTLMPLVIPVVTARGIGTHHCPICLAIATWLCLVQTQTALHHRIGGARAQGHIGRDGLND